MDVVEVVEEEVWGVRRRRRTAVEASAIRVVLSATQAPLEMLLGTQAPLRYQV